MDMIRGIPQTCLGNMRNTFRKRIISKPSQKVAFIAFALSHLLNASFALATKQNHALVIRSSTIFTDLRNKMKEQPGISPKDLAAYANNLLDKKGFDYNFDVCEIFKRRNYNSITPRKFRSYEMTQADGKKITFKFAVESSEDGMCGECFSNIPSLQVTKKEMLIVAEGKRYRLKRPTAFLLDEVELVDETMKKVLRTWQIPYQTIPIGISEDGTKLYLDVNTEDELNALVLEMSESGSIQFKARSDVNLRQGEWIAVHPKDPHNAYLSFMRFHIGSKSYIIRFSAPCT